MNEHHYQRIDKGIERSKYPAIPHKSSGITTHRPLKSFSDERRAEIAREVLFRYCHGEQVAAMAPEFETSDVTLYALLLKDHESEWKDLQTARALARLERENQALVTAQDPLSLARARELVRSAQWELERLLNRIFGPKQEMNVNHTQPIISITIVDNSGISADKQRVLEHTGVMSNPPALPDLSAK